MEISHQQAQDLLPAYVLGALPREEISFVRAHILSCDECVNEADQLSEVAAKLAMTVDPAPLDGSFVDKVMAQAIGTPIAPEAEVVQLNTRRRSPAALLSAAAAALIVAVMGYFIVDLRGNLTDTKAELVAAEADSERFGRIVSAVLHSDDGMELRGAGAVARVLPTGQGSLFVAAGMQEAPENHTYQLWLIEDGEPTSIGTFSGVGGIAMLESDHDLDGADAMAVTVEPSGGSRTPTTDPVMSSTTV